MIRTLGIVFFLLHSLNIGAQKFLQLEKGGSFNYIRYYIGEDITFKLNHDDKGWHTRTITDIDVDENRLVFYNHPLHIDSIAMIQLPGSKVWQITGLALQVGGANAILFSLGYNPIFNNEPVNWSGVATGAMGIVIGSVLRRLTKKKKFVPGKRKRLRVLDVTIGPVVFPPVKT
ncbi:MAG: hypothetical protein DRI69_01380 [Bacteroidetes bacterium]|nr:MAG: hypothetical protein DRI69_01380 [Bacteroidota bacterium]